MPRGLPVLVAVWYAAGPLVRADGGFAATFGGLVVGRSTSRLTDRLRRIATSMNDQQEGRPEELRHRPPVAADPRAHQEWRAEAAARLLHRPAARSLAPSARPTRAVVRCAHRQCWQVGADRVQLALGAGTVGRLNALLELGAVEPAGGVVLADLRGRLLAVLVEISADAGLSAIS